MIFRHGVAMIVIEDLETKEGRESHFKKESGKSMCLKNKHYENSKENMEYTEKD